MFIKVNSKKNMWRNFGDQDKSYMFVLSIFLKFGYCPLKKKKLAYALKECGVEPCI